MTTSAPALLVPPVRLGRMLREARSAAGDSLADLVQRSGGTADEAWFTAIEEGRIALDEPTVRRLGELYGLPAGELVPARSRLVIDLEEGTIEAGDRSLALERTEPGHILANYLALVYLLRGVQPGTPISLRAADLQVLSEALRRPERRIETNLVRLMQAGEPAVGERASLLRQRLVVPVAGVLVGMTSVGALLLVHGDVADATPTPATAENPVISASTATVEIGHAMVMERSGPDDPNPIERIRHS